MSEIEPQRECCSEPDCDRECRARGLCGRHYQSAKKAGTLPPLKASRKTPCAIADCSTLARRWGWCDMHWALWRLYGNPVAPGHRSDRMCRVDRCGGGVRGGLGLCKKHYQRLKKTGSLEYERSASTSYRGAHARVVRIRGHAREHPCIDCGQPASQWSYDNSDPSPLVWRKMEYSLDIDRYDPRCRSCHSIIDGAIANINGALNK